MATNSAQAHITGEVTSVTKIELIICSDFVRVKTDFGFSNEVDDMQLFFKDLGELLPLMTSLKKFKICNPAIRRNHDRLAELHHLPPSCTKLSSTFHAWHFNRSFVEHIERFKHKGKITHEQLLEDFKPWDALRVIKYDHSPYNIVFDQQTTDVSVALSPALTWEDFKALTIKFGGIDLIDAKSNPIRHIAMPPFGKEYSDLCEEYGVDDWEEIKRMFHERVNSPLVKCAANDPLGSAPGALH